MYGFYKLKEPLFNYAIRLFTDSGNTDISSPIFKNHTSRQVAYFDSDIELSLSNIERSILNYIDCISHLFNITDECFNEGGPVCFYSAELYSSVSFRSQYAYNLHSILAPALASPISVILFRAEDKIMISLKSYDSDVYLSDWYDEELDYDRLVKKIDIANCSLDSDKVYFEDLVYSVARWYYIYPITREVALYTMMPVDYVEQIEYENFSGIIDHETLKMQIIDNLTIAALEYGDDYVELDSNKVKEVNVGDELDLLAFEINLEDNDTNLIISDYFDEADIDNEEKDEYEFDELDVNIFDDPILMVKFLEHLDSEN